MATAHEPLHELTSAGRELRDAIPAVYSGYARLSAAAMGDGGELPAKMRELIDGPRGSRDDGSRHLDERRPGHRLGRQGLRRLPGVRG
jgi:hypothetical protein